MSVIMISPVSNRLYASRRNAHLDLAALSALQSSLFDYVQKEFLQGEAEGANVCMLLSLLLQQAHANSETIIRFEE